MYIFPEMIDLGLGKSEKRTSKAHKAVAQKVLLCNPRINSCDKMIHNVSIISKIPKDKIKKVTIHDLFDMGVQVNN